MEPTKDLAKTYWTQLVKDYISCYEGMYENLTDEDISYIVDNLLQDESMWDIIDSEVADWLYVVNKEKSIDL